MNGLLSRRTLLLGSAGLLMTGACGGGNPQHLEYPRTPRRSFVFGYLDMKEAPTNLDWMTVAQVAPPTDKPIFGMRISDGAFYAETLEPGSYVLDEFGSNGGFLQKPATYTAGRQDNPVKIVIDQPGVHYVGSFRYASVDTGFFEVAKFDLQRIAAPSEKDLLTALLPFASGTDWDQALRARVAQL